jgi:hypothetical protein
MAQFSGYSKVILMTEMEMTLYELMYERQPQKPLDAKALRWKLGGGWIGWLDRLFSRRGDHADYNRKA